MLQSCEKRISFSYFNKLIFCFFLIKELNDDSTTKIVAYSQVSDLNECLLELVYNSIDAKSKKIKIEADFRIFNLICIDDGDGIPADDLQILGEP